MGRNRKILETSTADLTRKVQSEKAAQSSMIAQDPSCLDKLPDDLQDAAARKEWRRIVPELQASGLFGSLDVQNIVLYCNSWSSYVKAVKETKGRPLIVQKTSGSAPDPMVSVVLKYSNLFQQALKLLRVGPPDDKAPRGEKQIKSEFGDI